MLKKSYLFIVLALSGAAVSCSMEENMETVKGNPDDVYVKPAVPDVEEMVVDPAAFDLLNLDYPGLESVKTAAGEGNYELAAVYLLDYYRTRVAGINPDVSFNPDCSADDMNRAKQATSAEGWRFFVNNYPEERGTSADKHKFWSFADDKGNINWDFCPEGVSATSEWKQKYRMQWMAAQAKVYGAKKVEAYVTDWMTAVNSFMAAYQYRREDGTYKFYGNGANVGPWEGLSTTARLGELMTSFEYYKHSKNFTPEFLCKVLLYIRDHVNSILANPWHDKASNIAYEQQAVVLKERIYFPEFKEPLVPEKALWLTPNAAQISEMLDLQFNEDGVHNELDLSYHLGVLANFVNIHKAVNLNGRTDLIPSDYKERLEKAAHFVQDMTYPSGNPADFKDFTLKYPYYTTEGFNSTRRASTNGNVILKNLKEYNLMFPEGDFLYMASVRAEGQEPSADLKLYPKSGYYIFRTGWDPEDMVLIHKNCYDPRTIQLSQHNQADNGTFSIYRNGRAFMPDAGVSAYAGSAELNAQRQAYASTSAHSTMNRAGADLEKRAGKLLASGKNGNVEYLVTENAGYSDLTHRRAIFFVDKKFFVIVDEGYGEAAVNDIQLKFMLSNWSRSENNVIWDEENASPFNAHTAYADNNNMVYKTFVSPGVENVRSKGNSAYYVNNVYDVDKIGTYRTQRALYMLTVNKPANKAARFITVIHPLGAASEYGNLSIEAEFTDNKAGTFNASGVAVQVTVGGQRYSLSYNL